MALRVQWIQLRSLSDIPFSAFSSDIRLLLPKTAVAMRQGDGLAACQWYIEAYRYIWELRVSFGKVRVLQMDLNS